MIKHLPDHTSALNHDVKEGEEGASPITMGRDGLVELVCTDTRNVCLDSTPALNGGDVSKRWRKEGQQSRSRKRRGSKTDMQIMRKKNSCPKNAKKGAVYVYRKVKLKR